jgi:hypothetical protein
MNLPSMTGDIPVSLNNGNSQQLPNGNTLICIGMSGFIYEIDSNQNQVWSKNVGVTIAQTFRYPPCFVNSTYTATASGSPAAICPGGSSQLDVTATGGEVYTYSWTSNPPGFISHLKNPVVSPDVTTTYIATITNGPCSATDSITITVNPVPPTPTISQSGDSLVSSSATGNQWFLNETILPDAIYQVLVPSDNGFYQVQVTDLNNCTSQLSEAYNVMWLGTEDFLNTKHSSIFPNPTSGIITFSSSSFKNKDAEILIFNTYGKKLMSIRNSQTADLSDFENGIYFIVILSGNDEMIQEKIALIK